MKIQKPNLVDADSREPKIFGAMDRSLTNAAKHVAVQMRLKGDDKQSQLINDCNASNKAFIAKYQPNNVSADSEEGHCIKAMLSNSMDEVLQARL